MALATIPVELIEVEQRLRPLSEAQVESLSSSIAEIGLLNPITVYARQIFRDGNYSDGFGLVAGAHRLEAISRLGLVDIAAQVVTLSDLERQIAECDENLCSTVLSKADRAMFTKRRKDAYEALHPETKHGVNQHTRGDANLATPTYAEDQAAKTGSSSRAVARDAERGMKISDKALAAVRGTQIDNGAFLDKLKSVPVKDQVAHVKAELAERNGMARRFKVADAPLNDDEAREKQVAALMAAWNKASAEAREEFLTRIDTPVMDRSAA